jgi:hypothetical protein
MCLTCSLIFALYHIHQKMYEDYIQKVLRKYIGLTNLKCSIAHSLVGMIKEVMKNVKNGCLRHDELLQILWVEVMTIHIYCRKEDGFHLVVTKLICWLVSCYQNLVPNITTECTRHSLCILCTNKVCPFHAPFAQST